MYSVIWSAASNVFFSCNIWPIAKSVSAWGVGSRIRPAVSNASKRRPTQLCSTTRWFRKSWRCSVSSIPAVVSTVSVNNVTAASILPFSAMARATEPTARTAAFRVGNRADEPHGARLVACLSLGCGEFRQCLVASRILLSLDDPLCLAKRYGGVLVILQAGLCFADEE